MEIMSGHKNLVLILVLISGCCSTPNSNITKDNSTDQLIEDHGKTICNSPCSDSLSSQNCFKVEKREDFADLKKYVYLTCNQDTVDVLTLDDAYSSPGELKILENSLIEYFYPSRGGVGMNRFSKSYLYVSDGKLELLFTKIVSESFHTEIGDVPDYTLECEITFNDDMINIVETTKEGNKGKEIHSGQYSIEKLKNKTDSIPAYL